MRRLKLLSAAVNDSQAWDPAHVMACSKVGVITWADFLSRATFWQHTLSELPQRYVAVQISMLDEFLACLWACWRLGKVPVLSSNSYRDLNSILVLEASHTGGNDDVVTGVRFVDPAVAQHDASTALLLFTSGSSGDPQRVEKQFPQLECELEALEALWGRKVAGTVFASTVSHHHMFGLPFGLLWPLMRGSAFYSHKIQYPESIETLAHKHSLTLITSPTQLENLHLGLDWSLLASQVKQIFSAGAPLSPQTAAFCAEHLNGVVTDIYGSTETGSIAWRSLPGDPLWSCLPHMKVASAPNGQIQIKSPAAGVPDTEWLDGADVCKLHADERFELLGRMDRIVKVGGKRVSLAALDQALETHPWVAHARTVMLPEKKNRLGAVIALTAEGNKHLIDAGKAVISHALKGHIAKGFDKIALPRFWRFVARLPVNTEGKVSQHALMAQFANEHAVTLPELLATEALADCRGYRLSLRIPGNLYYFAGHFPGTPVLPGVVQIAWAMRYAQEHFAGLHSFSHLEAIKFHNVILPDQKVFLDLLWHSDAGKLVFVFSSARAQHSSGRIFFRHA